MHYSGRTVAVLLVSAVMLLSAQIGQADSRVFRDPFAPPDLTRTPAKTVVQQRGKSPREIIREEAAKLELRATIRNGGWAMANINGTMVEEGETIAGFTLVSVGEYDALLTKEGIEVMLLMEISNGMVE